MSSNSRDAVVGADHHKHISGTEHLFWSWRGEYLLVSDDRHDRGAGAGAGLGVPEWPLRIRTLRSNVHLAGTQTGHLAGEIGVPLGDTWRTEDLCQGLGFFFDEPKNRPCPVRVIFAVQHNLEIAAATGDHTEPIALR